MDPLGEREEWRERTSRQRRERGWNDVVVALPKTNFLSLREEPQRAYHPMTLLDVFEFPIVHRHFALYLVRTDDN